MNMPWNQRPERSQETGEDQLSMIPTWSVVLAIIVFGAVQYLFHGSFLTISMSCCRCGC